MFGGLFDPLLTLNPCQRGFIVLAQLLERFDLCLLVDLLEFRRIGAADSTFVGVEAQAHR
ncbi:hypothetical protein SAMN03159379_05321 [Variovorax sp. NFACC26]|nr:hypothetical protein SAMN03159379_05321 [Variovorax sp. NFACC26]